MVIISVADRGPGVSTELHRKIFEKFYREQRNVIGAGLGLAICSGIMEAHDGQIWVENRVDGGAVFKFTVPAGGTLPDVDLDNDECGDDHD